MAAEERKCEVCGSAFKTYNWEDPRHRFTECPILQASPAAHARIKAAHARIKADAERIAGLEAALDHIGGLSRALRSGGPDPMDLQELSDALSEAVDTAHEALAAAAPFVKETK